MHVHQVSAAQLGTPPVPRLQCAYRLADVVDLRGTEEAGVLVDRRFLLADAADVLKGQLASAGWSRDAAAPAVTVEIHHLYLTNRNTTRVPIAAYRLRVGNRAPIIIRAQPARLNFWGITDESGYESLAEAMQQANTQMIAQLNQTCSSG